MADVTSENIKKRHIERQRRRIRQMKRRRVITVSLLIFIVLLIIILFTPLFNIRKIEVIGNTKVETSQIEEKMNGCIGKNIFRYGTGTPLKNIKSIPYVDNAVIKKSVFSCKVSVTVEESIPAACVEVGEKNVITDKSLKVLEVLDKSEYKIPKIKDITAVDIKPGNVLGLQNEEILNDVITCISVITNEDLLEGIEYISFKDIEKITFNYQGRLDVMCGGVDGFDKKIKLFHQAINTSTLTENSRGTIDLSVLGQAIYTP